MSSVTSDIHTYICKYKYTHIYVCIPLKLDSDTFNAPIESLSKGEQIHAFHRFRPVTSLFFNFSLWMRAEYLLSKKCTTYHREQNPSMLLCRFRYTMAAQDLVMRARGVLRDRGWRISNERLGSGDDISVFIIPLMYGNRQPWGGRCGSWRARLLFNQQDLYFVFFKSWTEN